MYLIHRLKCVFLLGLCPPLYNNIKEDKTEDKLLCFDASNVHDAKIIETDVLDRDEQLVPQVQPLPVYHLTAS